MRRYTHPNVIHIDIYRCAGIHTLPQYIQTYTGAPVYLSLARALELVLDGNRLDIIHINTDKIHTNADIIHTNTDIVHINTDIIHTNTEKMHTHIYDNYKRAK